VLYGFFLVTMNTKSSDPTEGGINWASDEVAENWSRNQGRRDEVIGPATAMMLDLADLQAGYRVLDVAAGTGDQTLLAARRIGTHGAILATDLSAAMLSVATEAARKAGFTNIETRVMNAQNLELEAESFDAVICRLGLMLLSNPPKALREIHRVLKRGGKFVSLVFSTAEKNPYQGIPFVIVSRLAGKTPPHFSLGQPGALENAFRGGGFRNVTVHAVSFQRHFSSAPEVIQSLRDTRFIREATATIADAERDQAWAEIEQELAKFHGPYGLELPGEMLIGVGTK
jgi:ubiquinone/menaquinone biosynthesis C-methylase UbiE